MLIPADRTIVSAIQFKMQKVHPYGGWRGGAGFQSWRGQIPTADYDQTKAGPQEFDIKFQFPPRITSDSRTGTWIESEMPGDQAIAVYQTSAARKMTLEWTYIIGESGGSDPDGSGWTGAEIKWNLSGLRSYYSQRFGDGSAFIIRFLYGLHGDPGNYFTCRMTTIDFSHKGGLIITAGRGGQLDGTTAFPLRTDVKVAMQLWTLGAAPQSKGEKKERADKQAAYKGTNNTLEEWDPGEVKFQMKTLRKAVGQFPQWE
jgi:hypothetical protein